MNNRYIFRGKRKDNGKLIYGDLIIDQYGKYYIHPNTNAFSVNKYNLAKCIQIIEVIPETVGQCTGLKDENGKWIFEGDIIITNKFGTPEIRYTIVYDKEIATFIGEYKKGCVRHFTTFDGDSNCFEVIGNIHNNPELLEVER